MKTPLWIAATALLALAGCANTGTLTSPVGPDKVVYHLGEGLAQASYVPSGVAEITRLQQREGYSYLRP